MKLKSILQKNLLGYNIPQEYVCLDEQTFENPLRVFVKAADSGKHYEVTDHHLFLGYKPVIIGIFSDQQHVLALLRTSQEVCLWFVPGDRTPVQGENLSDIAISCAQLVLGKYHIRATDGRELFLYKGKSGQQYFLNGFHRLTNKLVQSFKAFKNGNIFLPANLYDQVKIAYAVPRQISIITVGDGRDFNMFPTDLHGPAGKSLYVGSLRHDGRACTQVMEAQRICISAITTSWHMRAYQLGKNHMKELHTLSLADLHAERSAKFGFPLPASVISYRELTMLDFIDTGIHRIFFYKLVNEKVVHAGACPLQHVHREIIQWRKNQGMETHYILR